MMCRGVALKILQDVLQKIHDGSTEQELKAVIADFMEKCNYEELRITKSEVCVELLKEYIKFFNFSGISEYDIFDDPNNFYSLLEKNLEKKEWNKINNFLDSGCILTFYQC